MMCKTRYVSAIVFVCILLVPASSLQATTYSYPLGIFTSNGSYADSDELNLYVDVSDAGGSKVNFAIHNESLISSTIARVYFDGGFLTGIADIINDTGTNFEKDSSPGNLPGGKDPTLLDLLFIADFSAGATPPPAQNGIDPGESITVICNLLDSHSLVEILGQLDSGALRVGAHIISLPDGSSESAVTPEPATVLMLGLGGLTLLRKR